MTTPPNNKRPREWWICEVNDPDYDHAIRKNPEYVHAIHVIDYTAFQSACMTAEMLRPLVPKLHRAVEFIKKIPCTCPTPRDFCDRCALLKELGE